MAITFHPPDGKNDGRWGSRSTFLTCTPITFLRVGHYKTVKLNELPISKVATGMARNGPQALVFCRRPNSNLRSPRRKNLGCVTGAVTWSERGREVCLHLCAGRNAWLDIGQDWNWSPPFASPYPVSSQRLHALSLPCKPTLSMASSFSTVPCAIGPFTVLWKTTLYVLVYRDTNGYSWI